MRRKLYNIPFILQFKFDKITMENLKTLSSTSHRVSTTSKYEKNPNILKIHENFKNSFVKLSNKMKNNNFPNVLNF